MGTPESRHHLVARAALFECKRLVHRLRRSMSDRRAGLCAANIAAIEDDLLLVLAEERSPLWTEESLAERGLQQGKVQNLRVAVRRLNGAVLPAAAVFSFWKQIGAPTARRGFAPGRELREGCLIPLSVEASVSYRTHFMRRRSRRAARFWSGMRIRRSFPVRRRRAVAMQRSLITISICDFAFPKWFASKRS